VIAESLAAAISAATTDGEDASARQLVKLAPHLTAEQLATASDFAAAFTSEYSRATALTGLAAYLPADHRLRALDQAVADAAAVPDEYLRILAMLDLIPKLDEERREGVIALALRAVAEIRQGSERAEGLIELAPFLSDDQLQQALEMARRIRGDYGDRVVRQLEARLAYGAEKASIRSQAR
jgi:hypothetical protein